jgi:TrmH family RNA methyltransferase
MEDNMQIMSKAHLKQLAKLKHKKFRQQTGKVIIEGFRSIKQINSYGLEFDELYIRKNTALDLSDIYSKETFICSEYEMSRICSTQSPQEIAALLPTEHLPISDRSFLLYLDNISDPGNCGTIIRTATAAGISGIVLSEDSCDVFNPKVIRASLGSVFVMPIEYHDQKWLSAQNANIIITTAHDAEDVFHFELPEGNNILVIGSEAHGIKNEIEKNAHHRVHIPQSVKIESLNAAVAAGICMFCLNRKKSL